MEISRLDSTFKRDKLVEGWSSLVWTERYSTNGDFEMVSNDIANVLSLLPVGGVYDPPTVVAIADSDVPMVVESHKIEKPKNAPPKITTTGRSFETVLDSRVSMRAISTPSTPRVEWQVDATSAAIAARAVIKAIIVDGVADVADIIPEIELFDSTTDSGVSQKYPVEPKELYSWVMDTLNLGVYGLKAVRPNPTLSDKIAIIIYKGTDRSVSSSLNGYKSVVFNVSLEQFNDAAYLFSKLGYKNTMVTATANGMEVATLGTPTTGLARKVSYQDLSSDVTLAAGSNLTNLMINKGKVSLAGLTPIVLFSGGIAEQQAARYGVDYFLGDTVKLAGEYGLTQNVRIAEFVRTHDTTGIQSYPTLEAIAT